MPIAACWKARRDCGDPRPCDTFGRVVFAAMVFRLAATIHGHAPRPVCCPAR